MLTHNEYQIEQELTRLAMVATKVAVASITYRNILVGELLAQSRDATILVYSVADKQGITRRIEFAAEHVGTIMVPKNNLDCEPTGIQAIITLK